MSLQKWIAGAISGLLAAIVVDLNAWAKSDGKFDWGLALKRWVSGAITGVMGGFGVGLGFGEGG